MSNKLAETFLETQAEKAPVTRVLVRGVPANPRLRRKRKPVRQAVPIPDENGKKKRPGRVTLTRAQWNSEHGKALRETPGFARLLKRLPPRHAALLVSWATNGNNLHRSAVQLGMSVSTAKKIFSGDAFREARLLIEAFIPPEDKQWLEILPEARFTLRSLLKSPDDKVRYLAAKDIVDRAEGKSVTRIDMSIRNEEPSMTDAEMQLAFSIMQQARLGFGETLAYMKAHPEEVQKWVAENYHGAPKLPKGRDLGAVVVGKDTNGSNGKPKPRVQVWNPPPNHQPLVARLDDPAD